MTLAIAQEPADSADARALLAARDAENFKRYPPEARFAIPADAHVGEAIVFLVARDNGAAIGCGAFERHEGYGEMKSVFLLPSARGRRLGQEIVRALEQAARGLGYDEMRLETGIRSPWAIKTYERAGYRRCARFGDYPEALLSVFMMKRLPADGPAVRAARQANAFETGEMIQGEQP
jgi:putative acetyltransferase